VTEFLLILLGLLRILIRYKCGQNSCYRKNSNSFDSYHFHNQALIAGVEEIQGMGDASLIATYSVYETQRQHCFYIIFQSGAGLKLPGKFEEANNVGTVNQSFQLGTGSWDYFFVTEYVIRKRI
jgi:hypothetical protein